MGTQTSFELEEPFLPTPVRAAPRVWVEHVRIFAAPDRELRRLRLTPGLNVVWAPDAGPDERLGARIGHGAGKTLLCRILRHLLGEPDLAASGDAEALARALPEGFVEAEVHVAGARWAVRRPFDPKRESAAALGAHLEAIEPGEPSGYPALLEALRATLGASASTVGAADPWLTALAWMSRDQERRFGGPLRWRDRAASPSSKLARLANVERVRAIRSLLRVRGADDVSAERAVGSLEQEEAITVRQLADAEREIAWLSMRLSREGAGDASELSGSPLVLRSVIDALDAELEALDVPAQEPAGVRAARARCEDAVRAEAVQRAALERAEAALAEGDCHHCRAPHAPAAKGERELARRREALAKAERRLTRARARLDGELARQRARASAERRRWADVRERLARARELERHVERRVRLAAELERVQRALAEARADRERALREHAKQIGRVGRVFDFVVRRLAGQDVSGRLALGTTELSAQIRMPDGRTGTSPALRVLETLALDLTALILACEDRADLPGLWIHDSPREADLARSHYEALYRLAVWLEERANAPGFQYIITTTTSPPRSVAFRALRLGAASSDELLLRTAL